MKRVLIVYATREGHSRRIAAHLAGSVQSHGISTEIVDAAKIPPGFSMESYSAAILIASVHIKRHEPEMIRFVKFHKYELERIPTAFVSVSLSQAGVEDPKAPLQRREQAASDVNALIEAFCAKTGWRATRTKAVAGALLYTKYNFLVRFVMKQIARKAGGPTDTSKDYEFTDWAALDLFVATLVESLARGQPA
ncbi:MAG TPA: flavodoxin domain-containing protein [Bryobacteraceae bacterium]|nr:flavodoxin domain-containing protein [Bryobacteraceae bacterium]